MALSMQTNYASLVAQNTISGTNNLLNTALERLSTGYRINSAADDAAGLAIATKLEAQTRGMSVAMRNSQDAISMLETADGALDELSNIAYRMKDLATQAANGTYADGGTEQTALDAEYQQLATEMTRIIDQTTYGSGTHLLNTTDGIMGSNATLQFQIGASAAETLQVDASTGITAIETAITGLGALTTQAGANGEITVMEGMFDTISNLRGTLGANINRLEHTVNNLANVSENTTAAKGRIMDADFAAESSNMTKNQMLMQAGTTVLSQTNQIPGMAVSLLR
ncbi:MULTISPECIES: lateral flagellin LafA [Vibrio]|jgi:flagellin|uniref:Flagellin n=1 Tax=Vibrio diazotrophicus TaxID=685 RepID=A0A2J8HWC4_VIBDI|nr:MULTISPECIES: lateral flagellin LafA [Vibrio]MCF7364169.1 lateral flagellin LafA [Vibrio sp. A1-b2]MCZ4373454.1 lateral flagellin LafA [Vibrio diazotrophicus]PNH78837.1 Lateral flagellin [Vibrio diazotrophicus]PNH95453.1 Lateral flagellin [Vibrio diazotrophicus]PNI02095.1 Lateral flagellin [Vibrio diazotrophicus]